MKVSIIILFIISFLAGCKEKQKANKVDKQVPIQKAASVPSLSPILKDLAKFANATISDTTDVNQVFIFKQIDENQTVTAIAASQAIALYRKMMKLEQAMSLPIFEIKGADTAILLVQGVGFGGAIWGTILMDRKTLEIKKIEFDHKAESEGYGAAMTQSVFENKFVGTIIDLEKDTYTLQQQMEERTDNGVSIDGISGATMTNTGVVEMINEGLKKYIGYLDKRYIRK